MHDRFFFFFFFFAEFFFVARSLRALFFHDIHFSLSKIVRVVRWSFCRVSRLGSSVDGWRRARALGRGSASTGAGLRVRQHNCSSSLNGDLLAECPKRRFFLTGLKTFEPKEANLWVHKNRHLLLLGSVFSSSRPRDASYLRALPL